ncbi:MAG: mandelate racemase/muconate lactonizing enzyme family protein [Chloroflexi bacterium]|nr:mandelate racemase/muconate lactonizing enzyme family protein [Chloroflexota bacterium]
MRISSVRTLLLSAAIPSERRWTSDFGTNTKQDIAIVIVETDEGLTGYGEAKGTPVVMKVLVEEVLGPQIVDEDPTRVEFLWEKMYSASRLPLALAHGRPYHRAGSRGETIHAISGIDVALWDIFGKGMGVPIYRLLGGGVRDRLRAYASGGWASPELTAQEVLGYASRGFRGVKIRVGGLDEPHFPQRSLERLRIARDALGPDIQLMMDAHGALTVDRAVRLGEAARDLDITWFEEPVLADDDLSGLAEVRRRVPMPVSTGESETTRFAFRDIIDQRAADFLQPDIAVVGGITEARRVAALAHAHGFAIAPHVWGSALLWAASLQFAAATPNCVVFEFCQAYYPLLYDLLTTPVAVDPDGFVSVPSGAGLGVELQPEADLIAKYPFEAGSRYARPREVTRV